MRWQRNGHDLAFGQQYLAGGTDGWALALTSLRDFYGAASAEDPTNPAYVGRRLRRRSVPPGPDDAPTCTWPWPRLLATPRGFADRLAGLRSPRWTNRVSQLGPELAGQPGRCSRVWPTVRDPGPAVRVHGDYHLGQVMRTDNGWYRPGLRGRAEPAARRTPAADLGAERRSRDAALAPVRVPLRPQRDGPRATPLSSSPLARAWEDRNGAAFLRGYYDTKGIEDLLPADVDDSDAVRVAFELDKALYELAYEEAYRPDWVPIPLAALRRLLSDPVEELLAGPLNRPMRTSGSEAPGF